MKLRYSEAFYSVQGEGKFVGVPSVFLRTFGCNFRCQGFGMPRGTKKERHNPEVKSLLDSGILDKADKFEDLPIIHTGCDTYASIYPEFKKFMMDKSVDEVVEHLLSLTPHNSWSLDNGQDIHLVITGGEPLLGWQKFYIELFEHPDMKGLRNVTFETNATQEIHSDLFLYLGYKAHFNTTFSCSPKLTVSGEDWDEAIRPDIVGQYSQVPDSDMYLKFVVANELDVCEVDIAVGLYRSYGIDCPVYLMPMGGRSEEYNLNTEQVAKLAMEKGYRFSPRLHIDLFGNDWGT